MVTLMKKLNTDLTGNVIAQTVVVGGGGGGSQHLTI